MGDMLSSRFGTIWMLNHPSGQAVLPQALFTGFVQPFTHCLLYRSASSQDKLNLNTKLLQSGFVVMLHVD
jgi:hypothetical protein